MDKLTEYPQIIKTILAAHIDRCNQKPDSNIEAFLITNEAKGP